MACHVRTSPECRPRSPPVGRAAWPGGQAGTAGVALPRGHGDNEGVAGLRQRWQVAKWAGLGFCAPALLGWGLSVCTLSALTHVSSVCWQIVLHRGLVYVRYVPTLPPPPFSATPGWLWGFKRASETPVWWAVGCRGSWSEGWDAGMPMWPPFLLVALPTGFLFYLDRHRIPPHGCRTCGYDLTANTSGTCPECGARMTDGPGRVPGEAKPARPGSRADDLSPDKPVC